MNGTNIFINETNIDCNNCVIIVCQEGILRHTNVYDSDCDGSSWHHAWEIIPHSKIPEWEDLKNKIKPILTQKDIDNAIREIGAIKMYCKNTDYGRYGYPELKFLNKLREKNRIQDYEFWGGTNFMIKINDKWKLFDEIGRAHV